MNFETAAISPELLKTYLSVGITLLGAVFADNIFRSLVKVPKHFDTRRARRATAITRTVITIIVYAIAAYTILILLGIDLTPLLASATFVAIMLSVGARTVLEDFFSGLFLLSLDSIAVGDYIKIGETEGYIDSINTRTMMIREESGALHIISNSQIKEIVNFSRTKIAVFVTLPVKANQDITKVYKAAELALESLKTDKSLADAIFDESTVDGIDGFKESEVMNFRVSLVTYPVRRWEVGRKYRYFVKKEFEKQKLLFA